MLDAGTYRGRAARAKLGMTGTGKEQIAVEFVFTDPPGQRLTWFGFFTENTFERTIESLRACGWKGSDLSQFATPEGVLPEGMDQEVELVVEHDTYEGKTRARIAWVNSGGGLALKAALDASQARTFAARMKARIIAHDMGAGRKATPAGPAKAPVRAGNGGLRADQTPQDVLDAQANEQDIPF